MKKFDRAKDFHDAFKLRRRKDRLQGVANPRRRRTEADLFELKEFAWDLIEMGRDHQFPTDGIKA